MALNSNLDKDGQINKSKNDGQYKGLTPPLTGGQNGSTSKTCMEVKEKAPGKMFAGE